MGAEAITFQVAPEAYRAGDPILDFYGRRLLDQPLRLVRDRALDLRLAENNRTAQPEWKRVANEVGTGVGALVLAGPSRGGLDKALELLARLDRDDLILLWSIDVDVVLNALGEVAEHRAVRYRLTTARRIAGQPSAETSLLFYLEPEPGCPLERAPPASAATNSP